MEIVMNGKKKVGILATLALCVTVGGVYATWTYMDGVTPVSPNRQEVKAGITGSTSDGAPGILTFDVSKVAFKLDQANVNHEAEIEWNEENQDPVVTFEPAAGADSTIKANGIQVMVSFFTNSDYYTDVTDDSKKVSLYTVAETKYLVDMQDMGDTDGDGLKEWKGTIPLGLIYDSIQLRYDENYKLVLDTQAKYDAFEEKVTTYVVGMTVAPADDTAVVIPAEYTTQS